jgi:hypothetical protein
MVLLHVDVSCWLSAPVRHLGLSGITGQALGCGITAPTLVSISGGAQQYALSNDCI